METCITKRKNPSHSRSLRYKEEYKGTGKVNATQKQRKNN